MLQLFRSKLLRSRFGQDSASYVASKFRCRRFPIGFCSRKGRPQGKLLGPILIVVFASSSQEGGGGDSGANNHSTQHAVDQLLPSSTRARLRFCPQRPSRKSPAVTGVVHAPRRRLSLFFRGCSSAFPPAHSAVYCVIVLISRGSQPLYCGTTNSHRSSAPYSL